MNTFCTIKVSFVTVVIDGRVRDTINDEGKLGQNVRGNKIGEG